MLASFYELIVLFEKTNYPKIVILDIIFTKPL